MNRSAGRQSVWAGRFVAIMALPLALYALYATGQKALESYQLSQQAEIVRIEIQELQRENLRLQHDIDLHRGDAYVEKMAREQLGLVRPGDNALIVVVPTPGPVGSAPPRVAGDAPMAPEVDPPTWKRWWTYFFGAPDP